MADIRKKVSKVIKTDTFMCTLIPGFGNFRLFTFLFLFRYEEKLSKALHIFHKIMRKKWKKKKTYVYRFSLALQEKDQTESEILIQELPSLRFPDSIDSKSAPRVLATKELLSILQTLYQTKRVSLFYCHGKCSDQLHSLVPPVHC